MGWVGRDFLMIAQESMADLRELIAPYLCALIADRRDFEEFKRFREMAASRLGDFTSFKISKRKDSPTRFWGFKI